MLLTDGFAQSNYLKILLCRELQVPTYWFQVSRFRPLRAMRAACLTFDVGSSVFFVTFFYRTIDTIVKNDVKSCVLLGPLGPLCTVTSPHSSLFKTWRNQVSVFHLFFVPRSHKSVAST
jgi:hypothetical protein